MTTAPQQRTLLAHFDDDAQFIGLRQYKQGADQSLADVFWRVASGVAKAEPLHLQDKYADAFYALMASKKFSPGGRVLAGIGTNHGNALNCFVQAATANPTHTFDGVQELARKLALVTKVGGGNGINLDGFATQTTFTVRDVTGVAYMNAAHADVQDFITSVMRPPNMPDGDKAPVTVRNWTRAVYGPVNADLKLLCRQHGVRVLPSLTDVDGVLIVPDDLGGIMDTARAVALLASDLQTPRIDLSAMRPEGGSIRGSGGTSSGPVSFLAEIFDNFLEWANRGAEHSGPINTVRYIAAPVLRVISQGGTRRGAGMATINADSPHALDFLTAKDLDREASEGDISTFNVSFLVDDAFMAALDSGGYVPAVDYLTGRAAAFIIPDGKYDRAALKAEGVLVELEDYGIGIGEALKAEWLWQEIAQHAWGSGEPGLIFVNRVQEHSALKNMGPRYEIRSTNPCGEIPLTVGEPCDLGAINLAAYVFTNEGGDADFDEHMFRTDVATCVRFLDDVLDVNVFALEDNRVASQDLRRLGLGVMGMADMLIKMGVRYSSQEGRDVVSRVMGTLRDAAVAASEELGRERGVYPLYGRVNYHADSEATLSAYGGPIDHAPRRNVAVLTVAPTGTTSMLMGVSGGIEPIFSPFVWRKIGKDYRALVAPLLVELLEQMPAADRPLDLTVRGDGDRAWDWDLVADALSAAGGSVQALSWVPERVRSVFECAQEISPADHVRMQGAVQVAFDADGHLIGNSLSKTVNLPNSATVQDVKDCYEEAYRTGCKGVTVYRDGSRQFQVLSTSKAADAPVAAPLELSADAAVSATRVQDALAQTGDAFSVTRTDLEVLGGLLTARTAPVKAAPFTRPQRLHGVTDQAKLTDPTSGQRRSFLLTLNHDGQRVQEIILTSGKAGEEVNADSEALGRLASIALQHGVPASVITGTLRGVNGGLYGSYNNRLVGSKADLIAVALDTFKPDVAPAAAPAVTLEPLAPRVGAPVTGGEKCDGCGELSLRREEGCKKCDLCGYSKCG
ncbi:adenosylcobalamin-dependent ribonucleoside-diphosphate reductase [Deinococcus kurensis]|uniref:adenosylcobalamin-dependent ribonucleoside-diphosphate reductase n=1 Tax=Deinococcus kurensis TaxID=2662757 RepID=UPI0012D37124|nr:adenosylcobalamin-dependent ribonucleoside-diphosphate reductase [Deinococcus kurensis]